MKEIIHKIIAFSLTLIVLFSTTSFGVEKHICGEDVFSVSFFGNAEDCGMERSICEYNESIDYNTLSNESCCQDESIFIEASTVKCDNKISLKTNKTYFLVSSILYKLIEINTDSSKQYKNYISPLIIQDISVLYEVFLI